MGGSTVLFAGNQKYYCCNNLYLEQTNLSKQNQL